MMARRVLPVVLALAVAFAPAALEACETACAVHAMAAMTTKHACHDAAPASSAGEAKIAGSPHACSHGEELPVTAGALAQLVLHAPAVLPSPVDLRPSRGYGRGDRHESRIRDSIPIPLNLPLRV